MKAILSLIISGALVVSGYSQTRNVLVGTNNAVVQPTNFWSADASNARAGLGLGTAATNPASAFQASSAILSNLATGNGTDLTNITATVVGTNISITNISGLQAALDGKLATNGSAANLTSFPESVLQTNSSLSLFPSGLLRTNGDGSGLTNLPVPAVASNVLSTIGLEKGGTGATNAAGARTALGGTTVGTNLFTATDAASARTAIGLGTASTNPSSAFQPSSSVLTNLANNNGGSLTNISAANIGTVALASNITGTAPLASNVTGVVAVANGGTGGTNEATARSGIGLGTTNTLTIAGLTAQNITISAGGGIILQGTLTNAASFRNNIGLPWSGLTSADAPAFRTALGLGTAATNAATSFQSSSSALTNLAANNGGALTNLSATSIVGIIPATNINLVNFTNIGGTLSIASGGTGATNAANARQNLGSTTVGDALFIATNAASARTTIGATTVGSSVFTLANPSAITFLRLNADNTASALSASDFRTALSLGTAATNPSSAFQPASSALTNLASSNGGVLTNIQSFNIVGAIAISNGGSGATTAGGARTNLGLGATNEVSFDDIQINEAGEEPVFVKNESGFIHLAVGTNENSVFSSSDTVATLAVYLDFNNSTNAAITRTNLGLGATNSAFSGLSVGTLNTNNSVDNSSAFGAQNFIDSSAEESFAFGAGNKITNMPAGSGGSIVMGILGNMTNQGAFLFNGVPQGGTVGNSRGNNTFAVNASNGIYLNGPLFFDAIQGPATDSAILAISAGGRISRTMTNKSTAVPAFFGWNGFVNTAFSAAEARTNIGLSFSALTNTNTAGFNASLYGSNTNPVLVNTNGEVVNPTNFWQAAPINTRVQISQPVVSATNNATNARNLFLYSLAISTTGITNTIQLPTNGGTFLGDVATVIHEGPTSSITAVRQIGAGTNLITMNQFQEAVQFIYESGGWRLADNLSYVEPIYFSGTNASANAAASRTNLGLGAAWLTNTNVTNFRTAIELGATNNVTFNDVVASGTLTATSTVTAKTNLVVEGFVDFSTNHTNVAPATNNQIQKFLQIRIGTNAFFLPLYQ